ncbi:MAG TPA: tyrosine-type recombinase/integrase [candidate division Zixibacteria bacterium]|nr:tyrosine-type recombinase/integrase [candidate division Zixibacteria bacterium]
MALSTYLAQWVRDVRNVRPATIRAYNVAIARISPVIGHVTLADLSPVHVERLIRTLGEWGLAPKTVASTHSTLRRALKHAVRQRLIGYNPASAEFVDAPRVPPKEPRALSRDEVRRLLEAARGHRFERLIRVALGTGLRSGELRGLSWDDVDLERGVLHVRYNLRREPGPTRRTGRYFRDQPKTRRGVRDVPLSPTLVQVLREQREALIAQGFVPTGTGPVFPNTRGGPLHSDALLHGLQQLLEAAGLPRLAVRNLRTTFSTRLFEAGIPERRIRDLLGHAENSKVTHSHYIGPGEDWSAALRVVEGLVG